METETRQLMREYLEAFLLVVGDSLEYIVVSGEAVSDFPTPVDHGHCQHHLGGEALDPLRLARLLVVLLKKKQMKKNIYL